MWWSTSRCLCDTPQLSWARQTKYQCTVIFHELHLKLQHGIWINTDLRHIDERIFHLLCNAILSLNLFYHRIELCNLLSLLELFLFNYLLLLPCLLPPFFGVGLLSRWCYRLDVAFYLSIKVLCFEHLWYFPWRHQNPSCTGVIE